MVERIALHTRLRAGREADDERIHAQVPDDCSGDDHGLPRVWTLP